MPKNCQSISFVAFLVREIFNPDTSKVKVPRPCHSLRFKSWNAYEWLVLSILRPDRILGTLALSVLSQSIPDTLGFLPRLMPRPVYSSFKLFRRVRMDDTRLSSEFGLAKSVGLRVIDLRMCPKIKGRGMWVWSSYRDANNAQSFVALYRRGVPNLGV